MAHFLLIRGSAFPSVILEILTKSLLFFSPEVSNGIVVLPLNRFVSTAYYYSFFFFSSTYYYYTMF